MDRSTYLSIRNNVSLERRPTALAVHVFQDLLLLGGIYALCSHAAHPWLMCLASPLLFALVFRGFGIMHEAVHGAVSKNKIVNDVVGIIGGALCFLPYETWKKSHLNHHQWSGNVEKDSVMALIIAFPKMAPRLQSLITGAWKAWIPFLAFLQHVVFWNISFGIYLKNRSSVRTIVSLLVPFLFWGAALAVLPATFLVGVFAPAIFMYFVAIEVVNFPHHLQLPQFRGDQKFPAWQQYLTARSCIYPRWFAKYVVLNFNYHTEHHMFPDAPWYHLDKLHIFVKELLQDEYNSDPHFQWIAENRTKSVLQVLAPQEKTKKNSEEAA